MSFLLTSDLHLTDNPRDVYRFGVFPWIRDQIKQNNLSAVFILGDLTDKKDKHPAPLVSKICNELKLTAKLAKVIILKGNHDYIDPKTPFFGFLSKIKNILFVKKPTRLVLEDGSFLLLPHTRDVSDWDGIDLSHDYVFCHQTFTGAVASNQQKMEGWDIGLLGDTKAICISGDIHVGQKIGNLTYVGAPYHINFGDTYDARVFLIDNKGIQQRKFPCMDKRMVVIHDVSEIESTKLKFIPGDQVKVRLVMDRVDIVDYRKSRDKIQKFCLDKGVVLMGLEIQLLGTNEKSRTETKTFTKDYFSDFCQSQKLSESIIQVGTNIMKTDTQ